MDSCVVFFVTSRSSIGSLFGVVHVLMIAKTKSKYLKATKILLTITLIALSKTKQYSLSME